MDKQTLQQKIAEYFVKLPKEAQDVFSSMRWVDELKKIETNFKLNEEQIETLGTETTLLLLGILHIEEYKEIINTEIGLDQETARKIFEQIDINILKTIKNKLSESFESNALNLAEEKYGGEKSLKERFDDLPEKIKKTINESNYQSTLYKIADSYSLNVEQIGKLEEITTKVLLGIIQPNSYESELISSIQSKRESILKLATEIKEKIFKEILDLLQTNWNSNSNIEIPLPPYKVELPIVNYKLGTKDNKNEDDDEVPLPHYNDNPVPKKEEDFYKESGIEIIENKINDTYNPQEVVPAIDTNSIEREDDKIMKDSGIDIIGSKLFDSTVSTRTISDHSLPKMRQEKDPYKEEI